MPYINTNPLNTPYPYNPPMAPPPPYPLPMVTETQPWVGPQSPPKGPYGKLSNDGFLINYVGLTSDTAEVIVDNANRTIKVNVNINEVRKNFIFEQNTPSLVWDIIHNMNTYPVITLLDYDLKMMLAEIQYIDKNKVQVRFSEPKAGKAVLS